jgi:hypothetical protein
MRGGCPKQAIPRETSSFFSSGESMQRHRLAGSLIVAALLGGCASQNAPTTPPSHPVSPQELTNIRDAYRKTNPDFRVGLVEAVMSSNSTAALGDVGLTDFTVGDVITFIDSAQRTLAIGNVISIDTVHNVVIVTYTTQPGGRAPLQGDLGVRAIR